LFNNIFVVLSFATEKEQSAYEYYRELAVRMKNPETRRIFEHMAAQERKHKHRIDTIRRNPALDAKGIKLDTELLPKPERNVRKSGLAIQNAITLAIQREESANKLYTNLAEIVKNPDIQEIFITLAREEAEHKNHLERILKNIK